MESATANHAINSPKNINHFSHCHELELSSTVVAAVQSQQQRGLTIIPPKTRCSCCRFRPYGQIYICRPCNDFFLHLSCSKFPHVINHPTHGNHTLTLLPVSGYPGGVFGCDACNRYGDGFNYHCSICEFNIHPICAHKPCNFTHQFHSCPPKLIFKNPYNSRFWCDICRDSIESNEWRYRCNACDFDIHLHCTAACPAQPMVQGGKAQLLRWQHPRIPGGILINNQKQMAGSLVPQRTNTDSSVMRGGGQNIGSSNTAQFLQPQVGSAVQSKNSNALANAWVQGGAQQLGSMAVHGLIGGQRDRDGDGTEDGVNDVLDILGNLLLT